MKNTIVLLFFALFFTSMNLKAQEKIAWIDLNRNYEAGLTDDSYYQLYELPLTFNQKQIDELKAKTLKYNKVKDIVIVKNTYSYEVKLLLAKETEDISGYFRDYLLYLGINKVVVDEKKINTADYYSYISQRSNHKEVSK